MTVCACSTCVYAKLRNDLPTQHITANTQAAKGEIQKESYTIPTSIPQQKKDHTQQVIAHYWNRTSDLVISIVEYE